MSKYFRPKLGDSDEKEIMYEKKIKVQVVSHKENKKPRNEKISRLSSNSNVNKCGDGSLQTNNIFKSKVNNYKKYIDYVSSKSGLPNNALVESNEKCQKNKQTKSNNTGVILDRGNTNFLTLKKASKNIRQYMIISLKRIKREPEKPSPSNKTRDSRTPQFEDHSNERRTYTSNRRCSKGIIKYQTLDVIEEGEEPDFEIKFNSSNINTSYGKRRDSQIELEATLNKIKRTKEKMILGAQNAGMTSARACLGGKAVPTGTGLYYQPQRILHINIF